MLPLGHARATDVMQAPPAKEAFSAPDGGWELCVAMNGAEAQWATAGSTASLFRIEAGGKSQQWKQPLPHAYRPRFVLVSDSGQVVLFDQWINVAGPHAITVLDAAGAVVASHSFSDVALALGVPGREIIPLATLGSWMSAQPQAADDGRAAHVASGGKILRIDFATGRLGTG